MSQTPSIERDTPILPHIVADGVVAQHPVGVDPDEVSALLAAKADYLFAHNAAFRSAIAAPGNKGRDALQSFMQHWIRAGVAKLRRDVATHEPAAEAVATAEEPESPTMMDLITRSVRARQYRPDDALLLFDGIKELVYRYDATAPTIFEPEQVIFLQMLFRRAQMKVWESEVGDGGDPSDGIYPMAIAHRVREDDLLRETIDYLGTGGPLIDVVRGLGVELEILEAALMRPEALKLMRQWNDEGFLDYPAGTVATTLALLPEEMSHILVAAVTEAPAEEADETGAAPAGPQ